MRLLGEEEYKVINQWDNGNSSHYDLFRTVNAELGNGIAIAIRNNAIDEMLLSYEADGDFPPSREIVEQDFIDNDELRQWEREQTEKHFQWLAEKCSRTATDNAGELTRTDIEIDPEIELTDDMREIVAYVGIWFDVDAKFGLNTKARDDEWVNMYAHYDPFKDTLRISCTVSNDEQEWDFEYEPTENEANLIKEMIAEKIEEVYGQTPEEFCQEGIEENE